MRRHLVGLQGTCYYVENDEKGQARMDAQMWQTAFRGYRASSLMRK